MKSIRITLLAALALFGTDNLLAATPDVLAGTNEIEWPEADLSERMMNGAHAFVERQIEESAEKRKRFWKYDLSSAEAYETSVAPNRERLKKMIGVVDERVAPMLEFFGDDPNPALVGETDAYRVFQVRWPVLVGVFAEGLLVQPRGAIRGNVVLLPDADQLPEQYLGMRPGVPKDSQAGRYLGEKGFMTLIPALIDRRKLATEDSRLKRSDQTHREWIYRQAFHMGRHIVGYEVQTVLAAVDWFSARGGVVSVMGCGEGGLIAQYAAAADTRIDQVLVSGYFGVGERNWSEPIYRNVFGLLREFGDREIASLIYPRRLYVLHSAFPKAAGHKGEIATPEHRDVLHSIAGVPRIRGNQEGAKFFHLVGSHAREPFLSRVLAKFLEKEGVDIVGGGSSASPADARKTFDPNGRHARVFKGMENHVQGLVRKSEHVRDAFYLNQVQPEFAGGKWSTIKKHPTHDPKSFIEKSKAYRKKFHEELMGKFDEAALPFNARTRKVAETDKWTAYDVVLDVYPELFAWGALVVPKDLKPGERRPVVVCQHGRNGLPRDTIDANKTAYNDFAAKLAERGFITFAPHNLYRGEDRYRWLDRKANAVGATLFSFIIAQHDQILKWLKTQPFVDGDRMAFYGLSYGGETAVRVPAILEDYCLSICSGDFNQWTRKIAATDQPFSFMNTIEWEMPYWNLGHTFDYAEMAYLIFPRPFMVERGHHDRVGRDRWVAHEYGKVRWLYAQFGLEDKTEIEYFQGGHSINGEGTFDFLHKHLNWPKDR